MPATASYLASINFRFDTIPLEPALRRDIGGAGTPGSRPRPPYGSARPDPVPSDAAPDDMTQNGMQGKGCA